MVDGVTKVVEGGGKNGVNKDDWNNYWIVYISATDLKRILKLGKHGIQIGQVFVKKESIKLILTVLGIILDAVEPIIKDGIWFHVNKLTLLPLFPNKPVCGWQ